MERLPSIYDLLNGVPHTYFADSQVSSHAKGPSASRPGSLQDNTNVPSDVTQLIVNDWRPQHELSLASPSSSPNSVGFSTRFPTPESLPLASPALYTARVDQLPVTTKDSELSISASSEPRKRPSKGKDDRCDDCGYTCGYTHMPSPGVMHTAGLDTIRWRVAPVHKITELLRRAANTELKAAQLCPIGLHGDGLKRVRHLQSGLRLSATSTKSTKNDGGWSDNQTKELAARALTATTMMLEERGVTLDEIHERMCSDVTTQKVEANAIEARRRDPIWVGNFEGAHPDDIAKLLLSGFLTKNKPAKVRPMTEMTQDDLPEPERPAKKARKMA